MEDEGRGWEKFRTGVEEVFEEVEEIENRVPVKAMLSRQRRAYEEAEREGEGIGKYDSSDYTREWENILQL